MLDNARVSQRDMRVFALTGRMRVVYVAAQECVFTYGCVEFFQEKEQGRVVRNQAEQTKRVLRKTRET